MQRLTRERRCAAMGLLLLAGASVAVGGCGARVPGTGAAPAPPRSVARGAALYGAYCGGCHGLDGSTPGPVAEMLGVDPADLRTPGTLEAVTDDDLVERLRAGTPLPVSQPRDRRLDEIRARALEDYIATLPRIDWERLRAGRLLFEAECASCHGVFGDGHGSYIRLPSVAPPNLQEAHERYTDEALAALSVEGTGAMPRLIGGFEPAEMNAIIYYVRHLSPGYRLYDTYCAACHGDDGSNAHPDDALPPAMAAPRLDPARLAALDATERRATILHMLRRGEGTMPHCRGALTDDELRDIVGYLRSWEP